MTIPSTEYAKFYQHYINLATAEDLSILDMQHLSLKKAQDCFEEFPEEKYEYRYAEGKWTVKELLQHIIDTERIFAYRALRFARYDKTPLAGFEENNYADVSDANRRDFKTLANEFVSLRTSTIQLYQSFSDEMLLAIGNASNADMSVRALGYIISGHVLHHLNILQERYL